MTAFNFFVVAEPCINCKYTHCVAVCPVDCFYEGENFVVIDPEGCINCGLCEPECPSEAIFDVHLLPDEWHEYIELNRRLAQTWPQITQIKPEMQGAGEWSYTEGKRHLLSEKPVED